MVRQCNRERFRIDYLGRKDGRTNLQDGQMVRVVNLYGCPKANTMGHCHVQDMNGRFAGLVHCNSLHTITDWKAFLASKGIQPDANKTLADYSAKAGA